MSEVTLYSTGCPRCRVVTMKLDAKKIPYKVVDDQGEMERLGIQSVPALKVDDEILDFSKAIKWVNDVEVAK